MALTNRHIEILESLDWRVSSFLDDSSGERVEIETYSPAGEDILVCVEIDDFPRRIREYAEDFDVDEHVELWIESRGQRGVPETARELIEDAEAIQKMLNELADALESEEEP